MKKSTWLLSGVIAAILGVVLYAQEPARFARGIEVLVGNILIGGASGNRLCYEGSTVDASETCFAVTDPTADRTFTFGNANNTIVSWTLTTPTITGATLTTPTLGRGTTRTSHRQEFDGPCIKAEAADFTAELVVDAGVNDAVCNGSIANFHYRLDGDQASPFIVSGGGLDIDNDGADDEGVEIVVADLAASTQGWVVVGTSPAMYTRASITITSVSGTDNFMFGWRLAAAFVDNVVLETYDTYGVFHINDNAGNIEIQTGADGTDADDEADANPVWADAETIVLEVRVSAAGVFSFYQDDVLVTVTQATGAADAGDILVPFIGLLNAADADTELKINWIEIGEV